MSEEELNAALIVYNMARAHVQQAAKEWLPNYDVPEDVDDINYGWTDDGFVITWKEPCFECDIQDKIVELPIEYVVGDATTRARMRVERDAQAEADQEARNLEINRQKWLEAKRIVELLNPSFEPGAL